MRNRLKEVLSSLGITMIVFIILEVLSSTFFPFLGLAKLRIPFSILLVLYMGFKLKTPYVSILIFIVQYVHSFFSVEGWEMGTIAGIIIYAIISYFKEVIYLSSAATTAMVVQLFQCIWFVIVSALLYVKLDNFSFIIEKFWRFIPESLTLSLLAPIFFALFDSIWWAGREDVLGE